MTNTNIRRTLNVVTATTMALSIIFIVYGIQTQIFTSQTALQQFLEPFHGWAPLIFIVFQAIQVVFPILPGAIGCLGGVLIFGPVLGFTYNYIGICIGSVAAFLLAKRYGTVLIENIFKPSLYQKYLSWTRQNNRFEKLFAIAIFLPVAPDDFLCYLAGTTDMKTSRFITIILLGKPLAIAAYSFALFFGFQSLLSLL